MKFRSQLEESIARSFERQNIPFLYESKKFNYVLECNYTPDFFINNLIIEAKGFFKPTNRRLMIAVKKQHPELDIRFIFQRNNTLSKSSKTTYGDWADKHGFPWCIYPNIPQSWLEKPTSN